ncbi:ATP-binding protein [Spirillospora sp. CA-294931]|uniref:ATP-binding protein n=1 Tax=Spirillospora sp. CA-294931 TaxID=3240042 RepID=UPI003D8BC58B
MTIALSLLSRVAYDGREVTSPRLRTLLALLASGPRTGCATSRLVEGLWQDERPENPAKALQILVSRARSQLGPGVIDTTPTGYRLALDEEQVDAWAAVLRLAACVQLAANGDHTAALAEAERGLALWDTPPEPGSGDPPAGRGLGVGSGPPKPGGGDSLAGRGLGLRGGPSETGGGDPLAGRVRGVGSPEAGGSGALAGRGRGEGGPEAGGGDPSAGPGRDVWGDSPGPGGGYSPAGRGLGVGSGPPEVGGDDPLARLRAGRVETWAGLVRARALALGRLGRRAEAREALGVVAREWPRDEEVLLELLRCEAATLGPAAALARYDAYRRALRDELGADPGPALRDEHRRLLEDAAPRVRHGVAHEPNPLLGRDGDLAAVLGLVRASRVTSIVGPGGLGKTRLAHGVGREAEQRVVQLVPLAGVERDGDVVAEVAAALGVGASPGRMTRHRDLVGGIAETLGAAPALLVLDNCEHVVQGAAELVGALVAMTRDLRVLTTGRAPLGLSSESVYPLPELDPATAAELFAQRARAARPGVELPPDAVAEICRHLDGLPLAVELAAARVRTMAVTEIAARLDDRFALLRGGPRDAPRRHRTLHAVVDWSWNLLDDRGRDALRALAVFPGGFSMDAARHMVGDEEVVEHLVEQSLLQVTEGASGARLRMLETVREFAADSGEAVERFMDWARDFGLAHHEPVFGPDPYGMADLIADEQDNLVQALRYGLARSDGAVVAATSAVLGALWTVDTNPARLALLEAEAGASLTRYRPPPEYVEVTRTAMTVFAVARFLAEGPRPLRLMACLRRLPPAPPTTFVRAVACVLDALPERRALEALCESDEPLVAGAANGAISFVWEAESRFGPALAAARRMMAAFGDRTPWMRLFGHFRIGELCLQLVRPEEARTHLLAALRMLEEHGGRPDVVGVRSGLALIALQLGEAEEAERLLERAELDVDDDQYGMSAFYLGVRAEIELLRGATEAGLRLWRRSAEQQRDAAARLLGPGAAADPWSQELQAIAVIAHARQGRLGPVDDLARELPGLLRAKLVTASSFQADLPGCGVLLLALGAAELCRGGPLAASMVALAVRLGFRQQFQLDGAVRAAEDTGGPAYADAVSAYAGLGVDELRAATLGLLDQREMSRS